MDSRVLSGAANIYKSFGSNPTQIAAYFGISVEHAQIIAATVEAGETPTIPDEWLYTWLLLYGGVRSGKTFSAAFRAWVSCMFHPGNKILVVRKRKEQLRNTFLDEFEKVGKIISDGNLGLIGELQPERDGALEYVVFTGKSSEPSKVIFAIEPDGTDAEVVERWKGYTLGAAITEETSQLKEATLTTIRPRLSIKLDGNGNPMPTWMLSISNPVFKGHWLQDFKQKCEVEQAQGGRPPALVVRSRPVDNEKHLPTGYVNEQRDALKHDPIKLRMWVDGEDGLEIRGKPVFGAQWVPPAGRPNLHIDSSLRYTPFRPLIRGWDFGYHHPACVFMQEDDKGCINVLHEMLGKDETAEQFGERVLATTERLFPKPPQIIDYGDPAGAQQTDKGDTTIAILLRKGVRINFRPTGIDAGIIHIRNLLTRMRSGRPELAFHPSCADLIVAMERGYHYLQFKDGNYSQKPHKDGYFDHLVDAMRYALVNIRAMPFQETSELTFGGKRGDGYTAPGPESFGAR